MRTDFAFLRDYWIAHPLYGWNFHTKTTGLIAFYQATFDRVRAKILATSPPSNEPSDISIQGFPEKLLAGLRVLWSRDDDWDHVSVSMVDRCPTWEQMEAIKRIWFFDHETAMQLHVPVAEHRSFHPYCLHLWRPRRGQKIPRPPSELVAP